MTRKQLFTLIATIIGSGVVFLDGSIVNLALPAIGRDLGGGLAAKQWIVDGYLLSLSALILIGGSLGDIFGQRRVYFIGLGGFALASLLCGLAPDVLWLTAGRVLQGIFGAMLVPSGLAIINTNFEPAARALAIGRWTAFSSIVTALGPLVGGYLVDVSSWRWVFFVNIPLILATFVLGYYGIREHTGDKNRKLDIAGALYAMGGLGGLTYGLIEGPGANWGFVPLLAIVAGLGLLAAFVWHERRSADPMVKLDLFRSHNFTAANIVTFAMYGALGGFFFALTIYLQTVVGFSTLAAGASLLPVTVVMFLLASRAGAWAGTFGPRRFMTVGPALAGLGMILLLPLGPGDGYLAHVFPGVLLFAVGLALTVAPLTATVMGSVDERSSGIASGINNAVSRVSGLIVIAVLGFFPADASYHATTILCAALALSAGAVAFMMVKNPHKSETK